MSIETQIVDAVIVGAGFGGMYQLHRFRNMGLTTRVFDKASDVGGTWYWNRYPGARCDVESMAYSYSFSPELEQEWQWTEKYPTQPEILRYAQHVADRFDLRRDITFDTKVLSAHWDEGVGRWRVKTDGGETVEAQFLIMATGCLSAPKEIDIDGAASFRGPTYATHSWPHEGVDFSGQRVAVIGTGSSGIQTIPEVAKQAASMVVFQRTPNYSMPAQNRPLDPDEIAAMKAKYRDFRKAQRESGFGVPVPQPTMPAGMDTADGRQQKFQAGWDEGSLVAILTSYTDTLTNATANNYAQEFIRDKIRDIVDDPQTAEDLCPKTYPMGTKRPCLDTNYYATFNRDDVELVNLRRTPIECITDKGVKTTDAEYEVDTIVYATGFDAMTGALTRIDIRGKDGQSLRDVWADGPVSYLGLSISGFPNLFTVTGPSSPSVLSNMMVSIEQHVDWISDCIQWMNDQGHTVLEATPEAQEEWRAHVEVQGNLTLYPQADSWYMGANVPGKPRVFMAYIGGVGVYRVVCDSIAAQGYYGYVTDGASAMAAK